MNLIQKIRKRDYSVVRFTAKKISHAVMNAFEKTGEGNEQEADIIAAKVFDDLNLLKQDREKTQSTAEYIPDVEAVQDLVEAELILGSYVKTAKEYILYRERRSAIRRTVGSVPKHVKQLVKKSKKFFRNSLAEFIYYRTYARWIDEESRRETWVETVDRYVSFMRENLGEKLSEEEYKEVYQAILSHEAMPSMRLLQFAGGAARRTNVCAYNCSFIAPNQVNDFSEILYILMCGAGVGFSVERESIEKLPTIKKQTGEKILVHSVADSKEGWADALTLGLTTWYNGGDIDFDYSLLRPAGARLKTTGGKSSGPEPLRQLLQFARKTILATQEDKLSSLKVHDIICKIGECVVAGGVRRSALISLSNLNDIEMRDSKKGQFYVNEPQRCLANNSAIYDEKPSPTNFLEEWIALMKSGSGERGIFNRGATNKTLPKRRVREIDGNPIAWGTNPCGEIILRSKQFCNLSEVVARAEDTEKSLLRKIRIASIIGTYQSTLTNFPYLSKEWKENCDEERLLGVSITGQWDCGLARQPEVLDTLRKEATRINKEYSKKFGVPMSACITCVKPSGTLSQLVDCSSGMHPRHSKYYIRRVRISATDSLFQMLRDQGVPYHPEVGQTPDSATTFVLEFPVKAPRGATFKDDITAIEQLEHWKIVKKSFTDHNPSVTISIGESEWIKTTDWIFDNWDIVGGLSFLPRTDHIYKLAPYEEITREHYYELTKRFEFIDFSKIVTYERENDTDIKREFACVAGSCEI
ncbi:ribonucleoside-triphosphate reductase [bacterium]|jgi:ribonucleoside-triphosphate reductase (thioredoxin)|nr:ribonucleoside-triphosphate reductase [bacterium]MBT5015097.1 ribonucleoside-triphosphate reductase [bacterium]